MVHILLVLCFGALSDTARDTALDLVRSADALVPLLEAHGHADTVADAVPAPRGADTALDRPQGLGIGVPALHARVDELLPDGEQVLLLGAKHVDALAAGDLGVQAVLLCNLADDDQLVRRDLAGGDPRHDGKGSVSLDVAEEAVVGLLQAVGGAVHDVPVPQAGEDAGDGGLAGLAALGLPVVARLAHHVRERLEALHHDDVVQVGPRVAKVRAQVVRDLGAHVPHGLVEDGRDQRHAAAAARPGLGARLDVAQGLAGALLDDFHHVALGHVVARADLRVVLQVVAVVLALLLRAEDQLGRGHVELLLVLDQGHQLDVVAGVPDHHAAEQVLAVGSEEILLVYGLERVLVGERLDRVCWRAVYSSLDGALLLCRLLPPGRARRQMARAVAVREEVAKAGHVDAQQLELGAEIGPLEDPRPVQLGLRQVEREHVGHLDARRDEAKRLVLPARALADGVDVGHVGAEVVADDDAAAPVGALDARAPGQAVPRPHADGEADGRARHLLAVLEDDARDVVALAVGQDPADALAQQHVDAQRRDLVHHEGAGVLVELAAQDPAVALDQRDLGEAVEVHHGLGGLEPEEAAADDGAHGAFVGLAEGDEPLEVGDGAIHKHAVGIVAGRVPREHGVGARRQDQHVVGHHVAARARHRLGLRVDGRHQRVQVVPEPVLGGVGSILFAGESVKACTYM